MSIISRIGTKLLLRDKPWWQPTFYRVIALIVALVISWGATVIVKFLCSSAITPTPIKTQIDLNAHKITQPQTVEKDRDYSRLLLDAVRQGDTATVKVLLADGADVNANYYGETALTVAAERGY